MSTMTLDAALVVDHPAGQIVLPGECQATSRVSALAGYRSGSRRADITIVSAVRIDQLVAAGAN
ncbi:hypothetical protein AOZ06_10685 [Kibdelosporangium phytohabitans]|uniref:Uncharacterized protein n=1 Tax=Kibdelosporangium phytohabitans TaxID=860235 RepID=A0A0N9HZL1_9PSEU|nr:hypothetical protein AOZ06_10685 [Kibdelosporangium phytohabitans]